MYTPGFNLTAGLEAVQSELCASLADPAGLGGALSDSLNLGFVATLASGLLCGANPAVEMAQIPAMLDGSGGGGGMGTLRSFRMLAQGSGNLRVTSVVGLAKVLARHPAALAALPDLMSLLTVVPN